MRADGVVKGFKFPEQVLQVALAEDHEMIEAFGLSRPATPLRIGIQIGRELHPVQIIRTSISP